MSNTQFTIMVSKSPFDSRNAEQALAFCYAAIAQNFVISQVFFYQSGVHNASQLLQPASDEINMYTNWLELYNAHQVPLNVCVSASARRGVLSEDFIEGYSDIVNHANLSAPFSAVGLSAYFEALNNSDTISIQL